MKKILLFVISFAFASTFGQNTTLEELNYMNKGLKIQMESGLDMKKGYTLTDDLKSQFSDQENFKNFKNYSFSLLLRDKTNEIAGIVVWYKQENKQKEIYLGIPYMATDTEVLSNFLTYYNEKVKRSSYDYHCDPSLLLQSYDILPFLLDKIKRTNKIKIPTE